MRKARIIACVFIMLLTTTTTKAQLNNSNNFSLGGAYSATVYNGDITPSAIGDLNAFSHAGNVFAQYQLTPYVSIRLGVMGGLLKGDESYYSTPEYRMKRKLSFTTTFVQPSLELQLYITELLAANNNQKLQAYVTAGIGWVYFNVDRQYDEIDRTFEYYDGFYSMLDKDINSTLATSAITVPAGLGASYALSGKVSLLLEYRYHITMTDNLDGYSYIAKSKNNDGMSTLSLGLRVNLSESNGGYARYARRYK